MEFAEAYEAGYRDGSINYELEHCPACKNVADLQEALAENAKLRELARGLHMAYVETLNECESLNEELIWECSGHIDADIAKSRTRFEALRHRFDDALCELGIEVSK